MGRLELEVDNVRDLLCRLRELLRLTEEEAIRGKY